MTTDLFLAQTTKLAPLHIASGLLGIEGVQITELLLNALADPNVTAPPDDSYLPKSFVRKSPSSLRHVFEKYYKYF